jgi:carbonic anhydrase
MLQCLSAEPALLGHPSCRCQLPRRALLGVSASMLFMRSTLASSGDYEAMLINCIDPRFAASSHTWMRAKHMQNQFSQFVIAGGPIGAMHPYFAAWHRAFWDNLDITTEFHAIKRVIAFTHRDCSAARLAFGAAGVATPAAETANHAALLQAFRTEVARRKPGLDVVAGIMALDGSIEPV